MHTGDNGQTCFTTEYVEDPNPAFKQAKELTQNQSSKSGMRYKASITGNMLDEASKINAKLWGVSVKDAFAELISQKTDRAKRVMKILTEGRDFRKLQAQNY